MRSAKTIIGAAVLALGTVGLATIAPAVATPPTYSLNGRIAFYTYTGSDTEAVKSVNAAGTDLQTIIDNPNVSDFAPEYSPDGKKIAYVSWITGSGNVFIANVDGTGTPFNVTNGSYGHPNTPTWSPDGTRLAFRADGSLRSDIYTIGIDGLNGLNVTNTSGYFECHPDYSPDGQTIVFSRNTGGCGTAIATVPVGGGAETVLTNWTTQDAGSPSFSPDGTKIVFDDSASFGAERDIFVMPAAGGNDSSVATNLTPASDDLDFSGATWSPDGSKLAFEGSAFAEPSDIFVMSAGGAGRTNITNTADTYEYSPTWNRGFVSCGGKEATIVGTAGKDRIIGTSGDDVIYAGAGNDYVAGGGGNDTICGGSGDDFLRGSAGDDKLYGDAGIDTLYGDAGADFMSGGADRDQAKYYDRTDPIVAAIDGKPDSGGTVDNHGDTIMPDIEMLVGTKGNDTLKGNNNANMLFGVAGNDVMLAYGGNDYLLGGPGVDKMYGGDGSDKINAKDYTKDGVIDGGAGSDILAAHDTYDPTPVSIP